jgi:glyoxylase-like metal-dependent hydrolase (beta-lactamase superfamily II)
MSDDLRPSEPTAVVVTADDSDTITAAGAAALPTIGFDVVPTEGPVVYAPYRAAADIDVIPTYLPVPGMGVLPANSYLLHGSQPLLVDAGPGGAEDGFRAALEQLIDPAELRWLWLTHTDPDHIGGLAWLLDAAPRMRVITTFLAAGKLGGMHQPVPMDRMYWCNPGDTVHIGDRRLHALRPVSFDAPETTTAYDARTGVLFSADSFGALMQAPCDDADDIDSTDLADGLTLWSTIDAPWLAAVDRDRFSLSLDGLAHLGLTTVLSSHLPPAHGMTDTLLGLLARVPEADPWQPPDQSALDAILSQVATA